MKVALYSRVSTDNQEIDKQKKRLREWAEDQGHEYDEYSEVVSSVKERPEFEELMKNVDKYDALVVTDLDRFGRSTRDILEKIDELTEKDVAFKCIDQPMLNTDPSKEASPLQEAMRELMSVFASFERKTIRKRMEREYRKAVDDGKVGRPSALNEDQEEYVWNKYQEGYSFNTIKALVNDKFDLNISKSPIQRVVDEYRDDRRDSDSSLTEDQEEYVCRKFDDGLSAGEIKALVNDKFGKNCSVNEIKDIIAEYGE